MPTTEIPKSEWRLYFDSFSLRHEGWTVDLEVEQKNDIHDKFEVHDLPLAGITADVKDGENVISISVGKMAPELLRHEIVAPTSVLLTQTDDGYDKAIEIKSKTSRVLLGLRIQTASSVR